MAKVKTALIVASVASTVILIMAFVFANFSHKTELKPSGKDYAIVAFYPESLIITAEIADTDEKLMSGLMFRKSLGENEGMLFVFPRVAEQTFWMKNTLIPLDMVFISEDLSVVKIAHAVPCAEDPCQLYNSVKPAKYVLEINANLTDVYGIEEGSKVEITR